MAGTEYSYAGPNPVGIAFDGFNRCVANYAGTTVTKIQAANSPH
jgi:hypothetical protein